MRRYGWLRTSVGVVALSVTASFGECHCGSGDYWSIYRTDYGPYQHSTWTYDAAGRLTEHAVYAIDSKGHNSLDERQRTSYDGDGRVVRSVDVEISWRGVTTTTRCDTYDESGRLVLQAYDNRHEGETDGYPRFWGKNVSYVYDSAGRVTFVGCDGCRESLELAEDVWLDRPDGIVDHWRSYGYDAGAAAVQEVAYCLGEWAAEIERSFDAAGTLRGEYLRPAYVDADFPHAMLPWDDCVTQAYNERGAVTLRTLDDRCDGEEDEREEWSYDDAGNVVLEVLYQRGCSQLGRCGPYGIVPSMVSSYAYDAAGWLVVTERDGQDYWFADGVIDSRWRYNRDADGRTTQEEQDQPVGDPVEVVRTTAYDAAGRLLSIETDGAAYATPADGAVDNFSHWQYDAAGRELLYEHGGALDDLHFRRTCSFDDTAGTTTCERDMDGDGVDDLVRFERRDALARTLTIEEDGPDANLSWCIVGAARAADGQVDRRTVQTYDAAGNLVDETVEGYHDIVVGETWCYEDGECDDGADELVDTHCENWREVRGY